MILKIVLITFLPALFLIGCGEKEAEQAKVIRPVKFVEIKKPNQSGTREFPGALQAKDRVNLSFQVSGKLVEITILEGKNIAKGKLIGRLDDRAYKAKYDSAKAKFKNAKSNLSRASKLIKKEYISQSDLDKLQAKRDMAEANVRLAKKALDDTRLLAPFSGTIAKQYVRNYTDIKSKQKIVSLQNNNNLEVVVSVPENIIIDRKQNNLQLTAKFTNIPNEIFPLKLKEYTTEADASSRTYKVTLSLLDKKDYHLYPGMTATVFVKGSGLNYGILLPIEAVFSDPKGSKSTYVWVIDENNHVHQQTVTLGSLQGSSIEILTGLKVGEKVVTAGVHYLAEDQQIKLLNSAKKTK